MAKKPAFESSPYSRQSPFSVLGVSPSASAKEIQEAQSEKLEEIDYSDYDDQTRISKRDEIKAAYNAIRDAKQRAGWRVFVFDGAVGEQQAKALAERHRSLCFAFERILKGSTDVLPGHPELPDPRVHFRPVLLASSVRLELLPPKGTMDSKAEMIRSIRFER